MAGRYVISKQHDGRYHFVLKASNGQVILSSEAYVSRENALLGVESIRHNSEIASRFEVKTAADGRIYFLLKASNHQVLGVSQMYRDQDAAERGIAMVKELASGAETVQATA